MKDTIDLFPWKNVPDAVSVSTFEENSSESSFESVETSVEESCVQADFAERTANEMKEWMDFWGTYTSSPDKDFSGANLPHNSLDIDDESNDVDETMKSVLTETLTCCDSLDSEPHCTETCLPTTPTRNFQTCCIIDDMDFPPISPITPCIQSSSSVIQSTNLAQDPLGNLRIALFDREDDSWPEEVSVATGSPYDWYQNTSISTEDLHLQARSQGDQVDQIYQRLQWMNESLEALRESARSDADDDDGDDIVYSAQQLTPPNLQVSEKIYLCFTLGTHRAVDLAYISLCSTLPLEWLKCWVWVFEHSSRTPRQFILAFVLALLAITTSQLLFVPSLQPPPRRFYSPSAFVSTTDFSVNHVFGEILI